ncbi:MAG: SprB repeat-containing protein, partial [Bacteroidota bacterium]
MTEATFEGDSDGSATVTVNGGMPPYSYAWDVNNQTSATATNLATGPNIVTVTDAMGCARVDTVMVGFQFAAPMVDLGNDTTGAGPIVLRAGNFAGYEWQNASTADTFVVTSSGTYFVIVTDANGCQGSDTIVVNLWPVGTGELPTGG